MGGFIELTIEEPGIYSGPLCVKADKIIAYGKDYRSNSRIRSFVLLENSKERLLVEEDVFEITRKIESLQREQQRELEKEEKEKKIREAKENPPIIPEELGFSKETVAFLRTRITTAEGLSNKVCNALIRHGFVYYEDVRKAIPYDLEHIQGLGKRSAEVLTEFMTKRLHLS